MQIDTGAESTVISSKIWTELGKSQLNDRIRHLEAYDGHQLTLLGSLTCDIEGNGSRLTDKQPAVVQSDKEIGLLGRDILPKHRVNITYYHLPAVRGYKAHVMLIPGTHPMFCKPRKKNLYLFKTRSQKSWNKWSDRASLNRYSQEELLMHLQWSGKKRRVEK